MYNSDIDTTALRVQRLLSNLQFDLLEIERLELAEGEDKPKQSGNFKTTTKTESGKEIEVNRSPNGRFASESGGSSSSSESKTKETPEASSKKSVTEIMKGILNGDAGKQLKQSIVSAIEKNSIVKDVGTKIGDAINEANIKTGVQQAKFAEILGNGNDAIGNAQKYIKSKLDEISKGASDSETCQNIGKTLVAGLVAGACAGGIMAVAGASAGTITTAAVGAYAITLVVGAVQDSVRIGKRNAYNFDHRLEIAAKKDADAKFEAMLKKFDDEHAQKQLLEDVKTVAEAKREKLKPSESDEKAKPIFEATKDLDARVKDLGERTDATNEALSKTMNESNKE